MNQPRVEVAFLWHMHQPDYREQASGEYRKPWVYLHAIKDYADMAAHLERHPGIHAVVNFVPVLLDQINDYAAQFESGEFRDPLLKLLARENLDDLDEAARIWLVRTCFPENHRRMVGPFPRFERLHSICQSALAQGDHGLRYLSGGFFADLVTWYHLVWTGETERRKHVLLAELMSRGEKFSFADRRALIDLIGSTLKGVLPRYAALAQRGQIELSTTPATHPLAPLLIDLASAREALPDITLPKAPVYPGGAQRMEAQLEEARARHRLAFGQEPQGLWPAEGAVSEAFLRLVSHAGFAWTASSQAVLEQSLRRHGEATPSGAGGAYRPWSLENAPDLAIFFRDERMSDLIGFEYARWHGRDAAAHFVEELRRVAAEAQAGAKPLVTVALDGENAWEHYPYNAYYFFEDLYSLLELSTEIETTTPSRWLAARDHVPRALPGLVAGSWVYGSFSTWIGDAAKNRAWDLLCEAKQAFDLVMASDRLDEATRCRATAQLAVCEGSDWFWWFGDYNPREVVANFDSLYRANLGELYRLLQLPVPEGLSTPIALGGGNPEGGGTMRRAS